MSIFPTSVLGVACGLLVATNAWSQVAGFSMPDTVRTGTAVPITNTSVGGTTFLWKFCEPAWEQTPVLEKLHLPALQRIHAAAFGQQNGEHYAFVSHGIGQRVISRLNFGSSWANNAPLVTPLGDFVGLVNTSGGKDNRHLVSDNGHMPHPGGRSG